MTYKNHVHKDNSETGLRTNADGLLTSLLALNKNIPHTLYLILSAANIWLKVIYPLQVYKCFHNINDL